VAVFFQSRPALPHFLARTLWVAALFVPVAWAQEAANQPAQAPASCPLTVEYPLPSDLAGLRALAERQQAVSGEPGCLKSATFHAWRGATLLALGKPDEAVEPLERALLQDPDLPGAQLDLAQAFAAQGDTASAVAFLRSLRQRADLPVAIGTAIDRQLGGLLAPDLLQRGIALTTDWQSRWQFSTLAGGDSNLNNAPSASEITLTAGPLGNITLPLDPSSQPRRGGAVLGVAQWQGLRPHGESLWVLQAELRARQTSHSDTSYQQGDVAASWLQGPAAPTQWVGRLATGYLRYAGAGLLQATRTSIQYQWDNLGVTAAEWWPDTFAGCRPAASLELEHRRYPSSRGLDGVYEGGALGLLCRGNGQQQASQRSGASSSQSFYSIQARVGDDRPIHEDRPGGTYRRAELKAQWEGPLMAIGRLGVQWTTTRQIDRQPFSILLGNLPRHTSRHLLQLEASWPISDGVSLVGSAEAALQRSNLAAFESRQRSVYLGLRWELMQ
jgi:hypothetical protein